MKEIHIVFQVLNFLHGEDSQRFDLLAFDKLLLINLASHKGKKGICPSFARLSQELKATKRHIMNRIQYLSDLNLIKINRQRGVRNSYELIIPCSTSEPQFTSELQDTSEPQFTGLVNCSTKTSELQFTRYNKEVTNNNRESTPPVDNSEKQKQEQKPVDQYFTKQSYRFNMAEREEAIRRDIDIQICFNKFCDGEVNRRLRKDGKFKQSEWDNWFKAERDGKGARKENQPVQVNEHLIEQMREHERLKREELSEFNRKRWHELIAENKARLAGKRIIN